MAARASVAHAAAALAAALLLLAASGASAQSPPSSQCTSVLVSLSPCLKYISGNESSASAPCCAQLGKVVQSDPQCLCVALNADPASLGLSVNRTRALGLPDACKVKTPDVSNCKGAAAGGPATSPGTSTTPAAGETTPATGSKTTPATGSVPGAAASVRGSSADLVAGFVAAAILAVAAA